MLISTMVNKVNTALAGEMLDYEELIDLMDDVIDDVNNKMNTCFPAISEWAAFVDGQNAIIERDLPRIITTTTKTITTTITEEPEEEPEEDPEDPEVPENPEGLEDEGDEETPGEQGGELPSIFVEGEPDNYDTTTETTVGGITTTVHTVKTTVMVEQQGEAPETIIRRDNTTDNVRVQYEQEVTCTVDRSSLLDVNDYIAIPERYLRKLLKGVAYKFYIRDEEGERVASEYYVDYQEALFMILRDYNEFVPPIFRRERSGYLIGTGANTIGKEHIPEYMPDIYPGTRTIEGEQFRNPEARTTKISSLKLF